MMPKTVHLVTLACVAGLMSHRSYADDDGDRRERARRSAVEWSRTQLRKDAQPCGTQGCKYNSKAPGAHACNTPDPRPDAEDIQADRVKDDGHLYWYFYCARFVRMAYGQPARYASADAIRNALGKAVKDTEEIPAGALVIWTWKGQGHVGIYVGDGMVIHTGVNPNLRKAGVRESPLSDITELLDGYNGYAPGAGQSSYAGWFDPTEAPLGWLARNEESPSGTSSDTPSPNGGPAPVGAQFLGEWEDSRGEELVAIRADGQVRVIAKGGSFASTEHAGKWTILDDGSIKMEFSVRGKVESVSGTIAGEILRLGRENDQSEYTRIPSLKVGESWTKGAIRMSFDGVVHAAVPHTNAWDRDQTVRAFTILFYTIENASKTQVVHVGDALYGAGTAEDQYENRMRRIVDWPPEGTDTLRFMKGNYPDWTTGHVAVDFDERYLLKPGQRHRWYVAVDKGPIESARSFSFAGKVTVDNQGSKASYRLVFTDQDELPGSPRTDGSPEDSRAPAHDLAPHGVAYQNAAGISLTLPAGWTIGKTHSGTTEYDLLRPSSDDTTQILVQQHPTKTERNPDDFLSDWTKEMLKALPGSTALRGGMGRGMPVAQIALYDATEKSMTWTLAVVVDGQCIQLTLSVQTQSKLDEIPATLREILGSFQKTR